MTEPAAAAQMSEPTSAYWCERVWLGVGHEVSRDVLIEVRGSRVVGVRPGTVPPATASRLPGLVLPAVADAHSHAFHRALRGRTEAAGHGRGRAAAGTFWSWRRQMYALAERLDPDSYHALARAAYAELAMAGVSAVGEFHYLHHGPGGVPYADPNAMAHALVAAAREAGLRITLLDACYLTGGVGQSLDGVQRRFGDGDADGWAERADALASDYSAAADVVVGAAVHSVRAVPREQIPVVAGWATGRSRPLHVHVSEQVAENDECLEAYRCTPAQLLADEGALGPRTTLVHATHPRPGLVHATHPRPGDIDLVGASTSTVCVCPTTERELADGIGPARKLYDAGSGLSLGSDSYAVVDPYEQMRAVEMHERLATGRRGHWSSVELLTAATSAGHACLGWADAGVLAPGSLADLVAVRLDSVRTAGTGGGLDSVVHAASAGDVTDVVVGGRPVVQDGVHRMVGETGHGVGAALAAAVDPLWEVS